MRLTLHSGVWIGSVGLWFSGGLAIASATPAQFAATLIGELAIMAGALLFLWGVKWDGEHWWRLLARQMLKRSATRSTSSYMTPHEVTAYIAEGSEWGRKISEFAEPSPDLSAKWGVPTVEKKNPWLAAWAEFPLQAQREDTEIKVFGTPIMSASAQLIPHEFWLTNAFALECCLEAGKLAQTAPTVFVHGTPEVYTNLRIERAGVMKTWPKRRKKRKR